MGDLVGFVGVAAGVFVGVEVDDYAEDAAMVLLGFVETVFGEDVADGFST